MAGLWVHNDDDDDDDNDDDDDDDSNDDDGKKTWKEKRRGLAFRERHVSSKLVVDHPNKNTAWLFMKKF